MTVGNHAVCHGADPLGHGVIATRRVDELSMVTGGEEAAHHGVAVPTAEHLLSLCPPRLGPCGKQVRNDEIVEAHDARMP